MLKQVWGILLLALLLGGLASLPFWALKSNKAVNDDFLSLINKDSEYAFIFFGFRGCGDVCPTTLSTLNLLIEQVQSTNVLPPAVLFIDIDSNSNQEAAQAYVQLFNPDFLALHPDKIQLKQFSDDFSLNFNQINDQISHMGRTYLLKKNEQSWYLINTYNPNTFSLSQLTSDIN